MFPHSLRSVLEHECQRPRAKRSVPSSKPARSGKSRTVFNTPVKEQKSGCPWVKDNMPVCGTAFGGFYLQSRSVPGTMGACPSMAVLLRLAGKQAHAAGDLFSFNVWSLNRVTCPPYQGRQCNSLA